MSLCLMNVHGDIEGDYEFIRDIPNNATNGEVLQALFPKCGKHIDADGWIVTTIDGFTEFTPEWWNAPYKAE